MAANPNGVGAPPPSAAAPRYPDLAGKRVLVTGGSQGIGRAVALAFANNGANVAIVARTKAKLDAVVEQMGSGVAITADLTSLEDCERAVKDAIGALGGLDVVVNNGVASDDTSTHQPDTSGAFVDAFRLHVAAAVAIIQAALPELRANKGRVINVSSHLAIIPFPESPSYTVAKAALDSLTRVYALKYAKDGVRFNSVQSGGTVTEGVGKAAERMGLTVEQLVAKYGSIHALGRFSTAVEQAAVILFLASDASSFITGDNVLASGGAHLGFWFNAAYRQDAG